MKRAIKIIPVLFIVLLTGFILIQKSLAKSDFKLDLDASFETGTLSLDFTLVTPGSATWANYLILTNPTIKIIPLWSVTLPVIDPPIEIPVSFPVPSLGWIGIYSGLFTSEGAQAVELAWVDTSCWDTDGDGYLAEACGGDDCDDSDPDANPGAMEGPVGDPTCSDTVDNDCDGLTDIDDNGCQQCVADEDCEDSNPCTDDACVDFVCAYTQLTDLCDETERCSSAPGDDNYDTPGPYLCQGFCDGSGNCDYADQCTFCGPDFCLGTCGSGHDGCVYHLMGCAEDDCYDHPVDTDLDEVYCTGCALSWGIGGEIAASTCCGDDAREYALSCNDSSDNGDCGFDMEACCDFVVDCVDDSGSCVDADKCDLFGVGGKKSYCDSGTWEDPDETSAYCTAYGCGYDWLDDSAIGENTHCCGDDPGEDFEQSTGADRICCYNASALESNSSVNSILCRNGLLYDCNGIAADDSDLASHKATGDAVGPNYCQPDNTWAPTPP